MNTLPKISIITPSYNQEQFLREAIESVLDQNYPNLEYFIVDGGSTDGSIDIIKEFADRIDWWITERDEGQADAIYKGFERATGNLLGWLNSDDVYFPGALLKIGMAYAQCNEGSIYVGGAAIGGKGDGGIRACSIPTKHRGMFSRYGILGFGQQSSFFSADDYRQVGGLNSKLYIRMDGDIMYRLMKHNNKTVVVNGMVGFFRWHDNTKSTVSVDRYLRERDEFIKALELSTTGLIIRKVLFKLYRLAIGGYLKSFLATRQYRGMRMSEIWAKARRPIS